MIRNGRVIAYHAKGTYYLGLFFIFKHYFHGIIKVEMGWRQTGDPLWNLKNCSPG